MSSLDSPPPQLRLHSDLDGTHILLSGGARLPETFYNQLALLGCFFLSSAALAPLLSTLLFGGILAVYLVRWSRSGSYETSLHLTARGLTFANRSIPYTQLLRAQALGPSSAPQVHVQLRDAPPLTFGLENEPMEHAVWLAMVLTEQGKLARTKLQDAGSVPRALQSLRDPSTQ